MSSDIAAVPERRCAAMEIWSEDSTEFFPMLIARVLKYTATIATIQYKPGKSSMTSIVHYELI